MKNLEHIGSLALFTVTTSLVFHLIAMSFGEWRSSTCITCPSDYPLASWTISLAQRCYHTSVSNIFLNNNTNATISPNAFITQICLSNLYLMLKDPNQAMYCYNTAQQQPHTICSLGTYDKNYCKCK